MRAQGRGQEEERGLPGGRDTGPRSCRTGGSLRNLKGRKVESSLEEHVQRSRGQCQKYGVLGEGRGNTV